MSRRKMCVALEWRRFLMFSLVALGAQMSPARAAELTLWDFSLTYVMDAAGVPISYQVDGIYSHKIECATEWDLVSTGNAPIANPAHVITYKASYSEGLFRVIENKDGTQTSSTVRCPSYSLVAVDTVVSGWTTVCYTGSCNLSSSRLSQGISPAQNGISSPTPLLFSSACICASGAQATNVGTIPFTGRVYGALDIPGPAGIYRYALTGNMVGGVNWDSSSSGQPNSVSFPSSFLVLPQARPPFNAGVPAGSWRVWWNGN